ncbi:MAG TPA: serine/threonine-protein kinase, partial [Polyangiaceae bacterium]|nr:serine/threonine-protein kinase [Polyangiaceae bacterium]
QPRLVSRFLREARAACRLRGEHVARVSDVGRLDDGTPFMVMEYLHGDDLATLLDASGPLPVGEAVSYALQACEAIAEAHALGIVHRDIKPANLFLTHKPNGKPCIKVLDFGISKLADDEVINEHITATRVLLGTPHFMAPEQMRSARRAEARSDIYALGAVLYRMLVGRPPFDAESITELSAMVMRDPPPPLASVRSDIPPEVERVVMRCLEKEPERRYPGVLELIDALEGKSRPDKTPPKAERVTLAQPQSWPTPKTEDVTTLVREEPSPIVSNASWGVTHDPSVRERPRSLRWIMPVTAAAVLLLVGGALASMWSQPKSAQLVSSFVPAVTPTIEEEELEPAEATSAAPVTSASSSTIARPAPRRTFRRPPPPPPPASSARTPRDFGPRE